MIPSLELKHKLIEKILIALTQELADAVEAAKNAHLAATDDQSVAETQYDTLAIEMGYLAQGQSRRIEEIKLAINAYQQLISLTFPQEAPIALTALVQLEQDEKDNCWFFIGPAAAGFQCEINDKKITVITPQSPLGKALIDKYLDDEVTLNLGMQKMADTVSSVS